LLNSTTSSTTTCCVPSTGVSGFGGEPIYEED
jgi:hypothetical protein